jgi:glycosyltransferase involved in cell wall biosynthesis
MILSSQRQHDVEEFVRRFEPDLIHVHNLYPSLGSAVHLAAIRNHVPLVMTVHNYRLRCPNGLMYTEADLCNRCEAGNYANAIIHHCFPSRSQAASYAAALWTHRFLLKLERRVDMFIAPSEFVRQRLREWGIPGEAVRVIPNFVDGNPVFRTHAGDYGVYVGRLSGEKGVDYLLEALALAGDPPFRVVGSGPLEAHLLSVAAGLRLKHTVFMGRLTPDRVREVMSRARFLVMPSRSDDNAPLAVLEAMSAGCPVVVARRGGLPELVRGGGGMVCESEDRSGLADRIRLLMTDSRLCLSLGQQAATLAGRHFTAERHRISLETAYGELVDAA